MSTNVRCEFTLSRHFPPPPAGVRLWFDVNDTVDNPNDDVEVELAQEPGKLRWTGSADLAHATKGVWFHLKAWATVGADAALVITNDEGAVLFRSEQIVDAQLFRLVGRCWQ